MSMVKVEDVHKQFGDLQVLKGINFEVNPKEVVCIIGPSGSGKSTMLRCINRLERITSGKIYVEDELTENRMNGKTVEKIDPQKLANLCLDIGMVFQNFNLFQHLTVLENVTIGPTVVKKENAKITEEHAMELLEKVGMADRKDEYPARLDLSRLRELFHDARCPAAGEGAQVVLGDLRVREHELFHFRDGQ